MPIVSLCLGVDYKEILIVNEVNSLCLKCVTSWALVSCCAYASVQFRILWSSFCHWLIVSHTMVQFLPLVNFVVYVD